MKRILFSVAFVATCMFAGAQTLIKANFQKGDKVVYESEANMTIELPMGGGTQTAKVTNNTTLTVKDATPTGYVIEQVVSNMKTEGSEEVAESAASTVKYLENIPLLLQTDQNGRVVKVQNYAEVSKALKPVVMAKVNEMFKNNPQLAQTTTKEKLQETIMTELTAEKLAASCNDIGTLSIYGKTIKTGTTEPKTIADMIKGVTTYNLQNVLGTTAVVATTKSNMNEEDVKEVLKKQLKESGMTDEMVNQTMNNWGQLKAMGMDKVDASLVETFHLLKNGWVNDYAADMTMKMMGVTTTVKGNDKIVSHSWK